MILNVVWWLPFSDYIVFYCMIANSGAGCTFISANCLQNFTFTPANGLCACLSTYILYIVIILHKKPSTLAQFMLSSFYSCLYLLCFIEINCVYWMSMLHLRVLGVFNCSFKLQICVWFSIFKFVIWLFTR